MTRKMTRQLALLVRLEMARVVFPFFARLCHMTWLKRQIADEKGPVKLPHPSSMYQGGMMLNQEDNPVHSSLPLSLLIQPLQPPEKPEETSRSSDENTNLTSDGRSLIRSPTPHEQSVGSSETNCDEVFINNEVNIWCWSPHMYVICNSCGVYSKYCKRK